ncbi:MAG: glycosyltransferase family 4 protein, partial [Thermoplasmata archaeon]|nr:glycosyltransferase family 4 protein [Thermoplasmata archaeon]
LRGHRVTVVTSDVNSLLPNATSFSWGTIHPIHLQGGYASFRSGVQFFLKAIPMILRLHEEESFDVIHGHSAYPVLAPIDGVSSWFGDVPSVFTLYSPIRTKALKDRKGVYQRLSSSRMSRLFFTRIDCLTVLSSNTKESLLRIGIGDEDIEFLPPVVDSAFFAKANTDGEVRASLGIPENAPVILYMGNWSSWKGIDYLVDSLVQIRDVFPDIRLVTAWGEPYDWHNERKRSLERRIEELELTQAVVQVGIVDDLPFLIQSCDVVAQPFLNTDGVADLPLVILESMACGKPVISTRVGGIPEIITDSVNGMLVQPENPKELAEGIIEILKNKSKATSMGQLARDFAVKNHSSTGVVNKLESLYNRLLTT